jgi:hypothetical protein
MNIQNYQIHNVLNVYRRTLAQSDGRGSGHSVVQASGVGAEGLLGREKNPSIMDKVAADVIRKVTSIDPVSDFEREVVRQVSRDERNRAHFNKDKEFVFNTIDGDSGKATRSIAIDSSRMLMRRLDELAKSAMDQKP